MAQTETRTAGELEQELAASVAALEQARACQAAIADVLSIIARAKGDVQPVLDAIARHAVALCDAKYGAVTRFDGELVHVAAQAGHSPKAVAKIRDTFPMPPRHEFLVTRAILEQATVQSADVLSDASYATELPEVLETVRSEGIRSVLAVPLILAGRCVGSIGISRTVAGPYAPELVEVLEIFASQAVIAIDNALLLEDTTSALARQTATADVLEVISGSVEDTAPVFEKILDSCEALFRTAEVGITVVGDNDTVSFPAVRGQHLREFIELRGEAIPFENSVTGRALAAGKPVHIPHASSYPDLPVHFRDSVERMGDFSSVLAPMRKDGRGVGTIFLLRAPAEPFTEQEIALLASFADQAVIAIRNAQLFRDTQEALERQTATADILKVIASSPTDVQPVFDAITARAAHLLQAVGATATRFDGEWLHLVSMSAGADGENVDPAAAAAAVDHFPARLDDGAMHARAIAARAPAMIDDVLEDQSYPAALRAGIIGVGGRSLLAVPLLRGEEAIGSLMVTCSRPRGFSPGQIDLLQTFAAQAVIAIENVRLFKETREALEQQTAVSDILRVTTESPADVAPVLATLAEHAARLCDAASASIFLLENGALHHVASRGELAAQAGTVEPLPVVATSTSGRAVLERRTVQVEDMQAMQDVYPRGYEYAVRMGHRTIVVAPLMRGGEPFGVIMLRRQEVRPFSERELGLLRTFGDQAAIALESTRLFNETQEALEQQTVTADVLRVISNSVEDTAPVFEHILDSCERLFKSDLLGVFRVEGDLISPSAIRGRLAAAVRNFYPRPLEGTPMEQALASHTPAVYKHVSADDGSPPVFQEMRELIGDFSAMIVPMVVNERIVGSIAAARHPPRPFTDKEVSLLSTFAAQAAIAIDNARLFNDTREALEQQTATAEVLKVISSSVEDTAPVFEKIIDSCAKLFGTENIVVLQPEADGMVHLVSMLGEQASKVLDLYPMPAGDSVHTLAEAAGETVHFASAAAVTERKEDMRLALERFGDHSILVAPMMSAGRSIGTILVSRFPARAFTDGDVNLLTTFADQAVIAVQNSKLFNETREALERQTATAEILKVISASPTELEPVFGAIAERAKTLCEADVGAMLLYDGEQVDIGVMRGASAELEQTIRPFFPMPLSRTLPATRAIHDCAPVLVEDVTTDPDYVPLGPVTKANVRSVLSVPMMKGERCIGSITVFRTVPGAFAEKLVSLFQTFADQAVIAIENARLFRETNEALERQTATAEVLRVIAGSVVDTTPVFDKILESCERIFECDELGITFVNDERLELGAYRGDNRDFIESLFPVAYAGSATAVAIESGRTLHIEDAAAADSPLDRRIADVTGNYSMAITPMRWEDRPVGAIMVVRTPPRPFTAADIDLLSTFADQAVIAIENARLFREIEQ
ncbi:MAG: GAF domain-containing protein, partial [Gammaproteobacteria bacterium]